MKISIIIPAYNEEKLIGGTLAKIATACRTFDEQGCGYEVIVCDNNSTDRTAQLARDAGASVVFEPVNQIGRARNCGAAAATGDWPMVAENARRYLAVNPLVPQPHRWLARANEELKQPQEAIAAYKTVLLLDPPDPAEVHFRLARLLAGSDGQSAKQHVLMALEEAPRFREAHELLLKLAEVKKTAPALGSPKQP